MATKLFVRAHQTGTDDNHRGLGLHVSPVTDGSFGTWISQAYSDDEWLGSLMMLATDRGGLTIDTTHDGAYTGGTDNIAIRLCTTFPLAAAVTISGTISFNIWGRQQDFNGAGTDNCGIIARVLRVQPDGTKTLILEAEDDQELDSSNAVRTWSGTPTSTDMQKGDLILVMLGQCNVGGTMPNTARVTLRLNGPTDAADGDSYVTFTENMTFQSASNPPPGTKFYLKDSTTNVPNVTGARDADRTQGSSVVSSITDTVAGPTSGIQVTASAGGQVREWYTPRLGPFVLSGKVLVNLRGQVASGSGRDACTSLRIQIAKVDANGGGAVVWADDVLAQANDTPTLLSTDAEEVRSAVLSGPDMEFRGERIRIRVYIDDNYGAYELGVGGSSSPMVAGKTIAFRYNGAAAATGDSWIRLTETPEDFNPAKGNVQGLARGHSKQRSSSSSAGGVVARGSSRTRR